MLFSKNIEKSEYTAVKNQYSRETRSVIEAIFSGGLNEDDSQPPTCMDLLRIFGVIRCSGVLASEKYHYSGSTLAIPSYLDIKSPINSRWRVSENHGNLPQIDRTKFEIFFFGKGLLS